MNIFRNRFKFGPQLYRNADTGDSAAGGQAPAAASADPEDRLYALLGGAEAEPDEPPRKLAPAASDDDGEDDDEPAAPAEAAVEKFKVKVDGQEIEVTRDELLNGYSRQADYSKKTAEVAQQRQQAEQAIQAVQAERQQHQAQLAQLAQALGVQLNEQLQNTNWQQLLESDPTEYLRQRHLAETRQAALQQAQVRQQALMSQAQQEQAQQAHLRLQSEQQALLDKLPDWKDEAKSKAESAAVREYLASMGYQPQEIAGVADHRAVLMARKAMLYDQLQAKAADVTKRVSALPPKTLKPGVAEVGAADGRTRGMKTLARTGSTDAAASVLYSMFGGSGS